MNRRNFIKKAVSALVLAPTGILVGKKIVEEHTEPKKRRIIAVFDEPIEFESITIQNHGYYFDDDAILKHLTEKGNVKWTV